MSISHFAYAPNISIPRSKFTIPFEHKMSFNHGDLNVIDCIPILPGDTLNAQVTSFIRMSTPITPIMDNIKMRVHAIYVPLRLLWSSFTTFFGENKTTSGPVNYDSYKIPCDSLSRVGVPVGSIAHQLGFPLTTKISTSSSWDHVTVLKHRGYFLIWSEWYRAQQVQNPFIMSTGGNGYLSNNIGTINGVQMSFASMPLQVCKKSDYFTSATLSPQYSTSAVTLPLGSTAPVLLDPTAATQYWKGYISASTPGSVGSGAISISSGGQLQDANTKALMLDPNGSLVADLSAATAATINEIRYAFALQKFFERSNFGSRFFETLNLHYGVSSPDARLQRPEYLGGTSFYITISQVLQTTGYSTGSGSSLGATGAVSVTCDKTNLFTKAFVEPGYVYILGSTVQDQSYSQGINREDAKESRFEIYTPEFANIGDQEILNQEIFCQQSSDNKKVFGYQEAWAEYRYRPYRASGLLDPSAPNALDYWVLTNKFSSLPTLSSSFIVENRLNLSRALVTGDSGPDFIGDFHIDYNFVREMQAHNIPGLVDHFGTR